MIRVAIHLSAGDKVWRWSLVHGDAELAEGSACDGNEALAAAKAVAARLLDSSLEAEICSPNWRRSTLLGASVGATPPDSSPAGRADLPSAAEERELRQQGEVANGQRDLDDPSLRT
ncbi:hypothetical protein [Brevundimonas viscosa]|uniref:hypothetical protein n=1 Tax=Brevundimonas viscosa TaxID=871741 RepID=UPI0011603CDB|nr:hypothetical protein [Brevundimonas viscosa]